ncbi:MAG TPA: DUF3048 domain-containing protein [Acidimicrobiales bacterium]|nr:DUF3048 domain-containing protein [Acidimicrobiales bacterium]
MRAFLRLSAAILVAIAIGVVLVRTPPARPAATPAPAPSTTTTTLPKASPPGPRCPLTDAPAPGVTKVPARPAVAVKVGNEPDGARPQSGLNEADIVFDTAAEGFIMRYVAVFQCENAASIGPTRSVRWVDWNMIAPELSHPILAFAGGIDPNVNGLAAEPYLTGANLLEGGQAAGTRISSRVAPDNLYTSTAALYGLFPSLHNVPQPIFDFGAKVPSDWAPAASVEIDFSGGTDVVWKWSPSEHQWLHTYSGAPDIDVLTGKQVTTTDVVIEEVPYSVGPYSEHGCCSGDIESNLLGSGRGYVLRGGRAFSVTWHRPSVSAKTTFTDATGAEVTLAPGRIWVELELTAQGAPVVTP